MTTFDPYKDCPVLTGNYFTFRLVEENDNKALLNCYSDKKSVPLFNSDNCSSDFYLLTEDNMTQMIQFWLREYNEGGYVRFSILNEAQIPFGTLEIFAKKEAHPDYGTMGLLRIDLSSDYEKVNALKEILDIVHLHFGRWFNIDSIVTKAVPEAKIRKQLLKTNGYVLTTDPLVTSYSDYYVRRL